MGYILAAICGAILAGAANIILEIIKRQRDRCGVASALAGEISGILYSERSENFAAYFENLSKQLKAGTAHPPPWIIHDPSYKDTPVLNAYIDKIGLLGGKLPNKLAKFYSHHASVRLSIKILASGIYNNSPGQAASHIDKGLIVWSRAKLMGEELVNDLLSLCGEEPESFN